MGDVVAIIGGGVRVGGGDGGSGDVCIAIV